MYDILELSDKLVAELREIAKGLNIEHYEGLKKQDLIYKILDHQAIHPELAKAKKQEKAKPEKVKEDKPKAEKKKVSLKKLEQDLHQLSKNLKQQRRILRKLSAPAESE